MGKIVLAIKYKLQYIFYIANVNINNPVFDRRSYTQEI